MSYSKYYKAEDIFRVIDKIARETYDDTITGTDLVIEINKLSSIEFDDKTREWFRTNKFNRFEIIDKIHTLYNEIDRLELLLNNAIEKALQIGSEK